MTERAFPYFKNRTDNIFFILDNPVKVTDNLYIVGRANDLNFCCCYDKDDIFLKVESSGISDNEKKTPIFYHGKNIDKDLTEIKAIISNDFAKYCVSK